MDLRARLRDVEKQRMEFACAQVPAERQSRGVALGYAFLRRNDEEMKANGLRHCQ